MADAHQLRDLAASYRMRGSKEGSDLVACYNLDMATYLDYMAAIVEAAADGAGGLNVSARRQSQQEPSKNAQ